MKEILAFDYLFQEQVPQKYIENFKQHNPELDYWPDSDINNFLLMFLGTYCFNSPLLKSDSLESDEKESTKRQKAQDATAYDIYTKNCTSIFNNKELDKTLQRFTSGQDELIAVARECDNQIKECAELYNNYLFERLYDDETDRLTSDDYVPDPNDFDFYNRYLFYFQQDKKIRHSLPESNRTNTIQFLSHAKELLGGQLLMMKDFPNSRKNNTSSEPTFEELFNSDEDKAFVVNLMKELKITDTNGTCILSTRKRSALLGVICALRERHIIPDMSVEALTKVFAFHINTYYSRLKSDSHTYDDYYKKANTAILKRKT